MTAASSLVEASTRIRGSVGSGTWRKTCANSAGPGLHAQPRPRGKPVRRMAFISSADLGATQDTLSEAPSQEGAGEDLTSQGRAQPDTRHLPRNLRPRP